MRCEKIKIEQNRTERNGLEQNRTILIYHWKLPYSQHKKGEMKRKI